MNDDERDLLQKSEDDRGTEFNLSLSKLHSRTTCGLELRRRDWRIVFEANAIFKDKIK